MIVFVANAAQENGEIKMTKFEEVKRPDSGPLTELNNNMQGVFRQYRKMRQYADYLEYELKQKDEHILKVENENSFLRDEHITLLLSIKDEELFTVFLIKFQKTEKHIPNYMKGSLKMKIAKQLSL